MVTSKWKVEGTCDPGRENCDFPSIHKSAPSAPSHKLPSYLGTNQNIATYKLVCRSVGLPFCAHSCVIMYSVCVFTLQLRLSVLLSKCIARGANGLVAWEPGIFCATVSSGMYTAVHIYLHASCCLKGGPARRRQTQLTASANNDRQHTKQAPSLYLQLGGPRVVAIHNAIFAM